ncbi:MAG: CocE/NonD family hydrolase [Chloroflexota bacterium]
MQVQIVLARSFAAVLFFIITLSLPVACRDAAVAPSSTPVLPAPSPKAPSGPVDFKIIPARIPMSDGAKLAADIYLPQTEGVFPAILVQTPYDKSRFNPELVGAMKGEGDAFGFFETSSYAVVVVDWRGKFASKDAPPGGVGQNGLDGYDCVEWVARQPWCNGKVGTWGSSALGNVQYQTAARRPPHLTAIMPRVADYSNSYDKYYTGGVLRKEYLDAMALIGWGAFSRQAQAHPFDDGFYDRKDYINPGDVRLPMLLVGGWFDIHDLTRVFNDFMAYGNVLARKDFRLLIGPFTHEGVARDGLQGQLTFPGAGSFAREEQRKFFDRWLRGADDGAKNIPRITYYQTGKSEWRFSEVWPPSGVTPAPWYLQTGGGLKPSQPAESRPDMFVSNPKNPVPTVGGNNLNRWTLIAGPADQSKQVETHADVLIYTSEMLADDLTIAGDIEVKLYVSSDSDDTDVAVRLTDVYPDGRSMLVSDSIQRMSLLESFKTEQYLVLGQVYQVTIKAPAVAYTFLKGHKVRLIVTGSNYPRYALNTNTRQGLPKTATNLLYHDPEYPSALILPVMK